ncbi:MAG: phosphonate metabolism-associated iron-containing alcohol dehydrogenase [Parasphingorhabdus sp.]|jgi:phosphonate metabolism-associated iron-containing alcohol dehydrogenase
MWTFSNPVTICFGNGTFASVSEIIEQRPYCLVTYDEPYFKQLSDKLADQAGKPALIVNNITPNPDFLTLEESCRQFAQQTTDNVVIVALGGGSVIDAAKVLASSNQGFSPVREFLQSGEGEEQLGNFPIIAIPTTAGTGSEVTQWATVWDTESKKKYSLSRLELYPTHAVVDPELMLGLPSDLTISTGLDALSHALESLWNRNSNPVSANHAVFAAREVIAALPLLIDDLQNLNLRSRVARASLFAGLAFSNTKTALAHSVSYPITLKYNVPHGLACSFSLPMVLASVIGEDVDCDNSLRRIFGENLSLAEASLDEFISRLGVSTKASSYGVQKDEWKEMLTSALTGERGLNFIGSHQRVIQDFTI